jgi:thioredoxin-like negative regulator of GroEL
MVSWVLSPEGKARESLDKHLPSEGELIAEAEVNEAEALLAQGDTGSALTKLQEALAINPANDDARFDYVEAAHGHGRTRARPSRLGASFDANPLAIAI